MDTTCLANTCGALTSSGTPCRRYTIRGGTRCTLHGGGSPEARRVAEEMLAVARVPAARVLLRLIEDWEADRCQTCGRPSGDPGPIIRAATVVLDRAGLHPSMSVHVTREPENSFAGLSEDELIAQLEEMLKSARESRDAKRALLLGPSTQQEVIVVEAECEIEGDTVSAPQLQTGYSEHERE